MKTIEKTIQNLTTDEDIQQDLWVAYLSGEDIQLSFNKIQINKTLHNKSKNITDTLLKIPSDIKEFLTEDEKFLLFLLIAGYNIDSISMYNGISTVRNKQMLLSLRGSTYLKSLV